MDQMESFTSTQILLVVGIVTITQILMIMAPSIVNKSYLYLFVISTVTSFVFGNNMLVALFTGLFTTLIVVVFKYNKIGTHDVNVGIISFLQYLATLVFCILITSILIAFEKTKTFHISMYLLILYFVVSFIEWCLHRFVMHCYMYWNWLETISDKYPGFLTLMRDHCKFHKTHHLSINDDMTTSDLTGMFFDWKATILISVLVLLCMSLISFALRINVSIWEQLFIIISIAIAYTFAWNSVHPAMHDVDATIPLHEGPPNLQTGIPHDNLYNVNHTAHHMIKGDAKGNYNIIMLGADELLGTNRL
jgi:hypothetical protein